MLSFWKILVKPKPTDLDKTTKVVCECGKEEREVTFRNLKNRWPHCKKCKEPMKVISNAVTSI